MKEKVHTVHHILAHSYTVYFSGLILGILVDLFYPLRVIPKTVSEPVSFILIFLAPLLIFWAQFTSHRLKEKKEKLTAADFQHGPYKYSRNPTHFGLALLVLGFGFLVNSILIALITVVSYIISRVIFIREQDAMLERSYGEEYLKYRKTVPF